MPLAPHLLPSAFIVISVPINSAPEFTLIAYINAISLDSILFVIALLDNGEIITIFISLISDGTVTNPLRTVFPADFQSNLPFNEVDQKAGTALNSVRKENPHGLHKI